MNNKEVYFPGIIGYKNIFNDSILEFLSISTNINWDEMKTGSEDENPSIDYKSRRGKNISLNSLLNNLDFINFKEKINQYSSECLLDYSKNFGYWGLVEEGWVILKYEEGDFFKVHTDSSRRYPRQVSSVYYLNDDYEGGELHFPFLNITIKPAASELIFFPSTNLFSHEARPISKGVKYSMANWYN
jgi:Rps23 Pro-64 3,4-dihydroxylase Tpa1-like proline 4-hydroxylase